MSAFEFLKSKYNRATLRPSELAIEASLSQPQIRKLCRDGVIEAVHVGDRWIIPIAAAAAFLEGEPVA